MGMYAPVTQMRAAVKAGPGVVVDNRAAVGVSACALITSVAIVMPGKRAAGSCRVRQAVVYQRRRPERSVAQQVVQQSLETWLARRRVDWCGSGAGVVTGVVCQIRIVGIVHSSLVPRIKSPRTPNRRGLDLKLMINRA